MLKVLPHTFFIVTCNPEFLSDVSYYSTLWLAC